MYLFDTCVISYFIRNKPLKELYRSEMESNAPLFISTQTYGEIMAGVEKDNWGAKRKQFLETYLTSQFSILPIDKETALIYSKIRSVSASIGKPLAVADSWIAATAKQYGLVLVSHDGDMRVGSELDMKIICKK